MRSWTGSWLSTPPAADFGPGPEAEADGCAVFAFYASRRRLLAFPWGGGGWARSWTGEFLSTPLDTNFGPGPERAAEWRLTRRGVCIHRFSLSPTASGMARRPWRSGIWTKSLQGGCGEKRHWISFYNSQVQKLLRLHRFSADGPRLPGLPLLAGPLAPLVRHLRAA